MDQAWNPRQQRNGDDHHAGHDLLPSRRHPARRHTWQDGIDIKNSTLRAREDQQEGRQRTGPRASQTSEQQ